jgi:hypothetical protein
VFRIVVVRTAIVKLSLIKIKYKSEEIGREENNKNVGKDQKKES